MANIPPGARKPSITRTPPDHHLENPWDVWDIDPPPLNHSLAFQRPMSAIDDYTITPINSLSRMDRSRTANAVVSGSSGFIPFPEPQIHHSHSARPSLSPNTSKHRPSKSDVGRPGSSSPMYMHRGDSTLSYASSYQDGSSESYEQSIQETEALTLSEQQLISEEGLEGFQSGTLLEKDQEWHRLVPVEAREALGKQEVQRQSVLFELIKAERDYVADLQAVQDVFVEPLMSADPPIINRKHISAFIAEVFGNLPQILAHHQRIVSSLFARQREQHPVVLSVADILLDTVLKSEFRTAYEVYIKHYPIAESHHRKELKGNAAYQAFIQSVSSDHRIRKRDLITFLSRPVTRLPRLNLLLEQILKLTDKDYEHPDLETLPLIISILYDCIKSTQPGIEAAESKVKFWALCESLVFQKGEMINMDLYDPDRTLVHSGTLARRAREEWSSGWSDFQVALLDNFLVITNEETRSNGTIKRNVTSRPLPLAYLRLGSFNAPAENRKEHAKDGRLLESLRYTYIPLYPFTVYHATSKVNRRYTFYAPSEAARKKWHDKLLDAIAIATARNEGNMWFAPRDLTVKTFGLRTRASLTTGRIASATVFSMEGRKWIIAGTSNGIYLGQYGDAKFTKILHLPNVLTMAAVHAYDGKLFNIFVLLYEGALMYYPLDAVLRAAQTKEELKALDRSMVQIESGALFFRLSIIRRRVLLVYGSKKTLHITPSLTALEAIDVSSRRPGTKRSKGASEVFRIFGEPGYIPKDAYDVIPLMRNIAVSTQDGMVIADPSNIAKSAVSLVPDWSSTSSNPPMALLKSRIDNAHPLGIVRCEVENELLMIYDAYGFYITKHGKPTRASAYMKWESKALAYATRGAHILLFSPQFIEIREINTGKLVQALEGEDVRLLYYSTSNGFDPAIVVAMRAESKENDGFQDKVIELSETSAVLATPVEPDRALWDEWDM